MWSIKNITHKHVKNSVCTLGVLLGVNDLYAPLVCYWVLMIIGVLYAPLVLSVIGC